MSFDKEKNNVLSPQSLKKHPSILLHQDVAAISNQFLREFKYNIINLIRVFNDGSVFYLCDNPDWLQHYLTSHYPLIGAFEQTGHNIQKESVLWEVLSETDPILIDSRNMFNIHYGITIIRRHSSYCDYFNFGTAFKEPSELQNILSQRESMEKFIDLFYIKAQKLILKNEKNRLYFNHFPNHIKQKDKVSRLYLGPEYNYAYMTQKEVECLQKLSQGLTVPEIAGAIQSSARTVEKHIENIKKKLGCRTQFELGYITSKLHLS